MPSPPSGDQQDAWSHAGRAVVHAEKCLNTLLDIRAITVDDELRLRACIQELETFNRHETGER